eukprot:10887283-Karenia_brevis.AAC.1
MLWRAWCSDISKGLHDGLLEIAKGLDHSLAPYKSFTSYGHPLVKQVPLFHTAKATMDAHHTKPSACLITSAQTASLKQVRRLQAAIDLLKKHINSDSSSLPYIHAMDK